MLEKLSFPQRIKKLNFSVILMHFKGTKRRGKKGKANSSLHHQQPNQETATNKESYILDQQKRKTRDF